MVGRDYFRLWGLLLSNLASHFFFLASWQQHPSLIHKAKTCKVKYGCDLTLFFFAYTLSSGRRMLITKCNCEMKEGAAKVL
jgi:hypothetical protein